QRIDVVKAALQNELERLSELSHQSVQQVTAAAQQLTTQSDMLRSNLATSESALTQAAALVREESVQVPAIMDRSTGQIGNATKTLKEQAEATERTLIGTADRFIAVTTTARESMVD